MSDEISVWSFPFSKEDVAAWKLQHGAHNVHHVAVDSRDFVLRGLSRGEFVSLQGAKYRNEEDLEDNFVLTAMLYPECTIMALRESTAGLTNSLFERLVEISNVDAHKSVAEKEFGGDILPEGVTAEDVAAWRVRFKGQKLYTVELEGRQFIFRGLRRNEYERYREQAREKAGTSIDNENEIVRIGLLYPMAKDIDSVLTNGLYGTISSLAFMIMKVSGFGANCSVTKL